MYLSSKLPIEYFDPIKDEFPFPEKEYQDFKEIFSERTEIILKDYETDTNLKEELKKLPRLWERSNANTYMDEMNKNFRDTTPLIIRAGSWVRHYHTESFEVPDAMRSIDSVAQGEIIRFPNDGSDEEE